MIEEQATVVDREGDYVWVQTQRQSSCGQCSAKGGCGTQVLAKFLANKAAYVRCLNSHDVKIGDKVIIGIEESALLSGSFLMYLLPLLIMILFAGLAAFISRLWWPGLTDFLAVVAAFSGLILGLSIAQRVSQQAAQGKNHRFKNNRSQNNRSQSNCSRYEPVIIKKLPQSEIQIFLP
ncbi:MAG: SoxR reducing system RseC family protein [Gammaproteobacteria bacterium]|nr:SoxR reducing system RseC family protein [Gammaproteobacteria bacterium]